LCSFLINKSILLKILQEEEVVEEEEEDISKAGGEQTFSRRKGRFSLHSLQKRWII